MTTLEVTLIIIPTEDWGPSSPFQRRRSRDGGLRYIWFKRSWPDPWTKGSIPSDVGHVGAALALLPFFTGVCNGGDPVRGINAIMCVRLITHARRAHANRTGNGDKIHEFTELGQHEKQSMPLC